MPKQKKSSKRDLAAFQQRAEQILIEAGAEKTPGDLYDWNLDTKVGPWNMTIYDDWIATRFVDVDKAVKILGKLDLNPHTGKLNFHYTSTASAAAAEDFGRQLKYVLAKVNPSTGAKPRRNPAVVGIKPLAHKFDPARLPPGAYETSSQSAGYPGARFMVESGKARILSEQFQPGGHVLLTFETTKSRRNPEVEGERDVEVKVTRKWLESRTREYRDWRTAWWREVIQNSIDPGTGAASRVDLRCEPGPDGNWIVSCSDNGNGMTRQQVEDEDKGFLTFGGTGKATGSSIGGFGEAKQLLVFPWIQYRLVTSDQEYIGKGNHARAKTVPARKGVLLEVIMPADFHTTPEAAELVLSKSWIPNVVFTLNGKTIKTGAPTPSSNPLDEVPGQGLIFEAPLRKKSAATVAKEQELDPGGKFDKYDPADILMRKDGLWMFSEPLTSTAKHGLIVEVTGKSTEMFTSTRDGFGSSAYELREALDKARNEVASEGKVRSKLEKPVERLVRGTGKFSAKADLPHRAMEVREAIGGLPTVKSPSKGVQLGADAIEAFVSLISEFANRDIADLASMPQTDDLEPETEAELMRAVMSSPDAAKVMLRLVDFKGQKSLDAAVKQMVWRPDFFTLKDEGLKYRIPAKLTPEGMTPAVLRLLRTWAEMCRFILISIGSELEYGVGFWFSEEYGAGYLYRHKTHWLLLDPHKGKDRKEIYNPADVDDLKWLWSTAQHEVAHMLVKSKYMWGDKDEKNPQPASHGSDYAYALSDMNAKLADAWPKVRKIASSIKLRGQIEKPDKPSRTERKGESQIALLGAQEIANRISSFVNLYHRHAVLFTEATPDGVERMGRAYLRMMDGLKFGSGPMTTHSLKEAYRYIGAIFKHDQVYDAPVWIAVRPAATPGEYIVSISFYCFDIDNHVCNALKDQVRDARKLMQDDRVAYPRMRSMDVVYDFEDGMEQWDPEPEQRASNPCPCMDPKAKPGKQNPSHETSEQKRAKRHLYRGYGEKDFDEFDWVVIAALLDGGVVNNRLHEVEIKICKVALSRYKGKRIFVDDNGGELNLSTDARGGTRAYPKHEPLVSYSIPYTSNKFIVGDVTLAYRIRNALLGEQINYDLDLDKKQNPVERPAYLRVLEGGKKGNAKRIHVARIDLMFAEGPSELSGMTEAIVTEAGVDVWKKTNQVLAKWARKIVPHFSGGSWKQDYVITWADGEKFFGTYPLSKKDQAVGSIDKDVGAFVFFYSGTGKPEDMSEESYKQFLESSARVTRVAKKLLTGYDLGAFTPNVAAARTQSRKLSKVPGRKK